MATLAVEVRDLQMTYGSRSVLDGIDLRIERGEVVVLLGPNGAGKTTTLEVLEGFRAPGAGSVRVLGDDPYTADERWRARVGVVLQSWRDHGRWRVREIVELMAGLYAGSGRSPFGVDEVIEKVGLGAHARVALRRLSGGQRRRLDVALGVLGRPEILFLDEPTAGFDPAARRDFHDLIHELSDLEGMTILLTTHDLDEAARLADRILILDGGRIVADGSPEQLAREAATASEVRWVSEGSRHVHATSDPTGFVRNLLSEPGGNVSELEVVRATLEDAYMRLVIAHERAQGDVTDEGNR